MSVRPNIEQSTTLSASFYRSQEVFDLLIEQAFSKSWQFADVTTSSEYNQYPFLFLDPVLPEPLLLIEQNDSYRCMSNVCTHRGNILVQNSQQSKRISCNYHGRCFDLSGSFKSMPSFDRVENFPSPADHLMPFETHRLGHIHFVQLEGSRSFNNWLQPVIKALPWFPFDTLKSNHLLGKDYSLDAHWCLYVDNYLEGFHVPFVHPTLNESLDMSSYETIIYDQAVLQIGRASKGEPCFEIPEGQPYHGEQIYAFYFWLFPNMMLNLYPWGISLNQIVPIGLNQTKIKFRSFVLPNADLEQVKQTAIDATEMEDEAVVLQVQQGLKSRYYQHGRFSPTMEKGVHHFHVLLNELLKN